MPSTSPMLCLAPSSTTSSSYTVRRPARPITKCDRCRGRKSKCDSGQPCGPCLRSKVDCLYTDGRPTRGTQERSVSCIPSSHHWNPNQPTSTLTLAEERNILMSKMDTLQMLLKDATARQSLHAYKISLSLQTPILSSSSGIDLETDNLITHFSKLWLRKEPDQSFFQATHPALVKLRQDQIPRWQQSRRWKTWTDYQSESKYQQLTRFDPSLLPEQDECCDLFQRFITSCNWYFEVLTETEASLAEAETHHYRSLSIVPTTPQQWTRIALSLAVCRLTLACLDWAGTNESEQLSRKRCERILKWCDLAVMALQRALFDQHPTVEAMRVLIILTSTIFFETDYGLMGSSPQMLKLHAVAVDVAERLNLNRDPPPHLSSKEKDDRRRMWWALVTIDSHFCSTGATSNGVLRLQNSDTKLPIPRYIHTTHAYADESMAPLDLRSARSRFELGKFNNRCCQLLAQRRPLATLSDIWKLDQDLVALEARVPDEQRLSSDLDLTTIFQKPVQSAGPIDDALRNGQHIFYIGLWHIRSKIHRGLLYTKQTMSDQTCPVNVDVHRDIVRRCSGCLLHLYRHTKLPTAFISAIASAALTLSLELIDQPSQPYSREIQTIVLECFSRLQTNSSPIIGRACQVLEYFLEHLQPHTTPRSYGPGLSEWQKSAACVILSEDSADFPTNGNISYVSDAPVCQMKAPDKDAQCSMPDSGSSSLIGRFEPDMCATTNSQFFESTNTPSMVGLTNHVQLTRNGLLGLDEGIIFPHQDSLNGPWIEQLPESSLNGYSTDIMAQSRSIETPPFQPGSSISPNYLQLLSPNGAYETHLQHLPTPTETHVKPTSIPAIPSSMVYSNDSKLYPTIDPTKIFQQTANICDEGLYFYGPAQSLEERGVAPQIFNPAGQLPDAHLIGDLPPEAGPIVNRNYSMTGVSNLQNLRHA